MSELDFVVAELGRAYEAWKEHEKAKETWKGEFYLLANQALFDLGLATKVATYPGTSKVARDRANCHNPGWTVVEARESEGIWEFVLVEDPTFKAFAHEYEGVKYARQVSRGSVLLDEEWLQEENPELFDQVTFELPWGEHVMRPLDSLGDLLPAIQKYIYNGRPKVTLAPPRPVKED